MTIVLPPPSLRQGVMAILPIIDLKTVIFNLEKRS